MEIYAQAFRALFKNCGVTYSLTTGRNSNGGLKNRGARIATHPPRHFVTTI